MPRIFVHAFTVPADAIDALGHVNNLDAFDRLSHSILSTGLYRTVVAGTACHFFAVLDYLIH